MEEGVGPPPKEAPLKPAARAIRDRARAEAAKGEQLHKRGQAALAPHQRGLLGGRDVISDSPEAMDLYDDLAATDSVDERKKLADAFVHDHAIRNGGVEVAVVLDEDGVPLSVTIGDASSVGIPSAVMNYTLEQEGAYLTHYHPHDLSFSPSDILLMGNFGEVVAITPKGRYSGKPTAQMKEAGAAVLDDGVPEASWAYRSVISEALGLRDARDPTINEGAAREYTIIVSLAYERAGFIEYDGPRNLKEDRSELIDEVAGVIRRNLGRGKRVVAPERGAERAAQGEGAPRRQVEAPVGTAALE